MKSNVKWSTFLTLFDFCRKMDVTFLLKFIFVTTKVIPFLVEVTRQAGREEIHFFKMCLKR